jgi:hypothetical protein
VFSHFENESGGRLEGKVFDKHFQFPLFSNSNEEVNWEAKLNDFLTIGDAVVRFPPSVFSCRRHQEGFRKTNYMTIASQRTPMQYA